MRRDDLVLGSVEFADLLAIGLLLPLLPQMARRFGLGVPGAAALVAVPVITALLAAVWLGPLSARWGRKSVLVGTCLVTAEALFVLAWAGDAFMLFMARLATGVAAGNVAVVEASRRDLSREAEAGPSWKPAGWSLGAGLATGVVIGAVVGGASASAAAYAGGAVAVASLVGVVALLHETLPVSERARMPARRGVRSH